MLFIQNKYTKWYNQIIDSAKKCTFQEYTEKHHIIPKSMGGSNGEDNIVVLTARQHFVCHMLLTKMANNTCHRKKMIHALWAMTTLEYTCRQDRYRNNSKSYSYAKKLWSKQMSTDNPMHDPIIQAKRLETWKENRAQRDYIPPRVLKDKFVTPLGVYKTKKSIQNELLIPEHTLNRIFNDLDVKPTPRSRGSKQIDHLDIDYSKTWRENGFGYI